MEQSFVDISRTAILIIDAMALLIIVAATLQAFMSALGLILSSRSAHESREVWLRYARWLVAGLTFQLAADVIETSITTDMESVARLGIVAVIRTVLNYFLERDLAEVRERDRAKEPTALLP